MLKSVALALVTAATAAACSASEAAPASPGAPAQKASTPDPQATCVELMTRNRVCTEDFIPALVDARVKYDNPPGIKDQVAKDRDAVIAQAKAEWAEDSKDAAIAEHCKEMAAHSD